MLNPETLLGNKPLPDGELEAYIDCNGKRCYRPRGEGERMRRANRLRQLEAARRHEAMLRAEREARK